MSTSILLGSNIAKTIRDIQPRRVAVAYLGQGWRDYLPDISLLEYVVISPNLGTNPQAVDELVDALSANGQSGWDRVFLHDNLHAKLYLGESAAVFGSANLSRNGLGDNSKQKELCVKISASEDLIELNEFFKNVKNDADGQYKSSSDKKKRLKRLRDEIRKNPAYQQLGMDFKDFKLDKPHQFYVSWYNDTPIELTEASSEIKDVIRISMNFANSDNIDIYKWILCWKLNDDGTPDSRVASYFWMHIDTVIPSGVKSSEYPQLAAMINDKGSGRSNGPFILTREVIQAFQRAIEHDDVKDCFFQNSCQGNKSFELKRSAEGVPRLIELMKEDLSSPV